MIGSKALILAFNDDVSKENSRRMSFELQKHNIQPVFATVKTEYPWSDGIRENSGERSSL
jgi:hypothetical protein